MKRKAIVAIVLMAGAIAPASHISALEVRDRTPQGHVPGWALCPMWWDTARSVGWAEPEIWTLDYVMWRESRCQPTVHNPDDPWSGSYGLTQVNGGWTRWLRERGVLKSRKDLYRPRVNLLAALHIYNYANDRYQKGWNPWKI